MILALLTLLVVGMATGAIVESLLAAHRQSRRYADQLQAAWLAEAGLARGQAQLAANQDYAGEIWPALVAADTADKSPRATGEVKIRLETVTSDAADSPRRKLVAEAIYPHHNIQRVLVRRELVLAADQPVASSGENP